MKIKEPGTPQQPDPSPVFSDALRETAKATELYIRAQVDDLGKRLNRDSKQRSARDLFLENAILPKLDCSGAHLPGLEARGAVLRRADFWLAHLEGAHFHNAMLMDAKFTGANLQRAVFEAASLQRANLEGVDARGADFRGASMYGADLRNAHVEGALFAGCVWWHTDLRGAHFDDEVILPNGLRFGTYVDTYIPKILTAGGGDLREIVHEWWTPNNERLLYVAFGRREETVPFEKRLYEHPTLHEFNIPSSIAGEMNLFMTLYRGRVVSETRLAEMCEKFETAK